MNARRCADVIVVGAGIVGAACARALAQRGLEVQVLDDYRGGATAAGMGHLLVLDDNPAELALSAYSLQCWRDWAPRLPAGCAYRNNGTLWLAADAEELALAAAKQQRLSAHGLDCELLGGAALRAAEPALRADLHGALKVGGDGIVYAPNVVDWLLAHEHIRRCRAQVVELDGAAVRLADGRRLAAGAVVLATGIDAGALCPELPLTPKKGQLLITDRYPREIRHTLVELGYVKSAHQATGPSVACNIQPRPTGQLLIGSSRQFGSRDPGIDGTLLARMLKRAVHYVPGLATLNAIRCWSGLRAASPDGQPLLGPHPHRPGLWLALGHEGLGITTAPGSAELLAAQLCDERPPLPVAPFLPQRLLPEAADA